MTLSWTMKPQTLLRKGRACASSTKIGLKIFTEAPRQPRNHGAVKTLASKIASTGNGTPAESCVFGRARDLSYFNTSLFARHFHSVNVWQQHATAFSATVDPFPVVGEDNVATNSAMENDEGIEIAKLPISEVLVANLAKRGITKLFPIQRAVLEPALKGQDLIARAKTGTGKTLAFGIPILDRIIKENDKMQRRFGKAPLAIVMAPTRELAKQVETEFKDSAPTLDLVCVYGGADINAQIQRLKRGVDIAVGTPGRIIDLLDRGELNLREVKYVVLDEADRMLAVGFVEAIQKIFGFLPPEKQSMLFSATMPDWVRDLSKRYLKNSLVVDLVGNNEEKIAEGIKLLTLATSMTAKKHILGDLIKVYGKSCKSIIFTQTKRDADDVAASLGKTLGCEPLHGDITQAQRERTLKSFRDGKISILIATDVAARGLDIPNVDLVIHYEIATDTETFVHRSGRTGRAGRTGTAILVHTPNQRRAVDMLERDLGCKFQSISIPSVNDVLRATTEEAVTKLVGINQDVRSIFLPTAEKLLAEEGVGAFAAALAAACGYKETMLSRSLLTHEQGFMTLKITCPTGPPITSATAVMRSLSQILPSAANSLGKVCMLSGPEVGAVFDLPMELAKELLSVRITTGEVIQSLDKLPNIVEDFGGENRFGRPFQRGTYGNRPGGYTGGFSGGRPGGFSNRPGGYSGGDSYNRSPGGDSYSRSPSSFGSGSSWGSQSSNSGSVGGSSSWSNQSPSSSSFGSGGSYSNRSFSGNCLRCGQAGHRAMECPNRQ